MTAYRDYIVDFPGRCLDILKHFEPYAKKRNREVTLILMAASSAFLIPRERLVRAHPSRDSVRFGRTLSRFNKELDAKWGESSLSKDVSEWRYGVTKDLDNGPDAWPAPDAKASEKNVSEVLAIIRNALAHGNLFTEGNSIHTVVFYSEKREKHGKCEKCKQDVSGRISYKFLKVPVAGFRQFLFNWFDLLDTIPINSREALEELATAA